MSPSPRIRGPRPVLLAAFLAASGVFPAHADALAPTYEFGTDYAEAVVTPNVSGAESGARLRYVVTDPAAAAPVVTETTIDQAQALFQNLSAGKAVLFDTYIIAADGVTTNAAAHDLVVMGREHDDDWLCETAETFTNATGSGTWTGREFASVSNDFIQVDTTVGSTLTSSLICSFAQVPKPRRGHLLATEVSFPHPYTDLPDPTGQRFGLTVASVDTTHPERASFLYVENGGWTEVPWAVCNPLSATNWFVCISVDLDGATATYCVRPATDQAWTLLGTAANVGSDSARAAVFRGVGAVRGLDGNGFDTQVLDLDVEFSAETLYPGCDFKETVITGHVTSAVIHSTSLQGGSFKVRLTGMDGTVVETADYAFAAEGTVEFYVKASDLTAGTVYRAEVVLNETVEAAASEVSQLGVMSRILTNSTWAVTDYWIREDAETFDGTVRGSGLWKTNDESCVYAWTTNGWIQVQTASDDERYAADAAVTFTPTNAILAGERLSGTIASVRAVFTEASGDLGEAEAVFGFTVVSTNDAISFACLSNRTWQIASNDRVVPELGVAYELSAYCDTDQKILYYFVKDEDGNRVLLMTVALDAKSAHDVSKVNFIGSGLVGDLSAQLYSSDLVHIHANFEAGTLYPGTNFEASTANGYVTFDKLWETSHTNGMLLVVVRDKFGNAVSKRRVSFHDLERCDFKYYITGLQPGETYSVDIEAEVRGIVDRDGTVVYGSMARVVTNAEWAVSNCWIREDYDTFVTNRAGTGNWTYEAGTACGTNGLIAINTLESDDALARVNFQATNALPKHTGFEMRSQLFFDAACSELPSQVGDYGITLVDTSSSDASACQFAVLTNGVWMLVDADVYVPETGVEYDLTLRVDYKRGEATYLVKPAAETNGSATVLACYACEGSQDVTPYETDFYGLGRVRTHEGDGFDVTLVEISADLDERALEPGTNFTETVASGVLKIRQIWMTDKTSGTYTFTFCDAHGGVVATQTLTYDQLTNQTFSVSIPGLEAGAVYDVTVDVELGGETVSSDRFTTVMGREFGDWIRENVETFTGAEIGTGLWLETNTTAYAADDTIRIDVSLFDPPVGYNPTNDSLAVRNSTVREIRFALDFEDIAWYADGSAPTVPANTLAGATVWSDDAEGKDRVLAVISTNGNWRILEETRNSFSLAERNTVKVLIDYRTGFVRYDLETPRATNTVYQYDIEPGPAGTNTLAFSGAGRVWSVDGDTWDPHLITDGTNEYWNLDEAILGTDGVLSPLWWANQLVTVGKGEFRVFDTNHWLTVRFPWWYYVVTNGTGGVTIYRFNQSNNWIDYAEDGDENIETNGVVWLVKTAEGLSWIAARATNEWISGRIELDGDIDLTAHNWTPIAGFSGTFDGCGQTIVGLNNTNRNVGIPGGEYLFGPTNAWGRSTYGLFGTATNATLLDVTFAGVAISNLADSVATLVGALAGNCVVSNVTVDSGSVLGAGGTAAGLAGFADFGDFLTVINNTNRAKVTAEAELAEVGRWAAGLLCVAGPTNAAAPLGTLVVTNNVNFGTVSNTIYDLDLFGGNVAQILAGATLGARFGEVHLTNNFAFGAVEADIERSSGNVLAATNFPVVNLASSFWGYDENETFWRWLEADDPAAIPVDPVHRTARMRSNLMPNGVETVAGAINDRITALPAGSVLTLDEGFEGWGEIRIDRDLTLDLGGNTIFTVYINNTIEIGTNVTATVRNGTIVVGLESEAFAGDQRGLTQENLTIEKLDADFLERTVLMVDGAFTSAFDLPVETLNAAGTVVQLFGESPVSIDLASGTLCVLGVPRVTLSDAYAFSEIKEGDEVVGYRVSLADNAAAAPTATVTMTATEVKLAVGNTLRNVTYTLQQKGSLAESEWTDVPGQSKTATADGEALTLTAPKSGEAGYYRVVATDPPVSE